MCSLEAGDGLLVHALQDRVWTAFLDTLSGRSRWKKFTVVHQNADGETRSREIERAAVVPAPGREEFVGTTVGEQLQFYAANSTMGDERARALDQRFGFCFFGNSNRSVWDLGTGERRCLLTISQAIAEPACWLFHEPLGWLDGPRRRAMEEFISDLLREGKIVLAGSSSPEELIGCCRGLLVLGDTETELVFHGNGGDAAGYLAELRGLGNDLLEYWISLPAEQ